MLFLSVVRATMYSLYLRMWFVVRPFKRLKFPSRDASSAFYVISKHGGDTFN